MAWVKPRKNLGRSTAHGHSTRWAYIDHTCDVYSANYLSLLFDYGFLQGIRWREGGKAGGREAFHPVWAVSHVTGPAPSIILFWPLNWLQTNCCDLRGAVMLCNVLLKYNTCHYVSLRLPYKPTLCFHPHRSCRVAQITLDEFVASFSRKWLIYVFFFIWFVRLLALRPLLAYCASLGW
jgi:hypothetical protein